MASQWRGIFTIPVTPLDAQGDVDDPSLDHHELDTILEDVGELFTLAPLGPDVARPMAGARG
jgi:hypothetical protein